MKLRIVESWEIEDEYGPFQDGPAYWKTQRRPIRWRNISCDGSRNYYGEFSCQSAYDVMCEQCVCAFNHFGGTLTPLMSIDENIRHASKSRRRFLQRCSTKKKSPVN